MLGLCTLAKGDNACIAFHKGLNISNDLKAETALVWC